MSVPLADIVLYLHFLYVLFVVGGTLAVWTGAALRWQWIRNRRFRLLHAAAIGIVVLESLTGIACPLTVLEDALRNPVSTRGFLARWVRAVMFYDLPEALFMAGYIAFGLLVLLTWFLVPLAARGTRSTS